MIPLPRRLDQAAAIVGIWAIKRLFNPQCAPADYEPGCMSCEARRLIGVLRDVRDYP